VQIKAPYPFTDSGICYPNTQEGRDRPNLPGSKKTVIKRGRLALVLQEPESLREDGTNRREMDCTPGTGQFRLGISGRVKISYNGR